MRMEPSVFTTGTMGVAHSENSTGWMMPSLSSQLASAPLFPGAHRGQCVVYRTWLSLRVHMDFGCCALDLSKLILEDSGVLLQDLAQGAGNCHVM